MRQTEFFRVLLLLAFAVFSACGMEQEPNRTGTKFTYQDEVGFSKMSVISVVPWEEAERSLIPTFKLDSDQALQKVAQYTRSQAEETQKSLNTALSLSFPAGGTSNSPGATKRTAPAGTNTGIASGSPSSGTTPSIAAGASAGAGASSPAGPATAPLAPVSASTQYMLAYSLFQEVRLLNSYVKYVAKDLHEDAYLATIDVTLIPATRNAAVDALVIVAFIGKPPSPDANDPPGSYWSPHVVPVILSEDIESSLDSIRRQRNLELALQLAGAFQGVGASAKVDRAVQTLQRLSGNDVNSLQLVGSASPSALIVRFGASYVVGTDYALIPQIRRVHCLILVPHTQSSPNELALYAVAHAAFRYTNGDQIDVRPESQILKTNVSEFTEQTGIPVTIDELGRLWSDYTRENTLQFEKDLGQRKDSLPVAWAEMARLSLQTHWSYSLVNLPPRRNEPFVGAIYTAFDDGKVIRLRLPGYDLSTDTGLWTLRVPITKIQLAQVLPTLVTDVQDGAVDLQFQSFALDGKKKTLSQLRRPLDLVYQRGLYTEQTEIFHIRILPTKVAEQKPVITVVSTPIAAESDGAGEMLVEVGSKDVAILTLEGGTAVFAGPGVDLPELPVNSSKSKRFIVSLRHLVPGMSFTVVARKADDKEVGRISVSVIASGRTASAAKPGP